MLRFKKKIIWFFFKLMYFFLAFLFQSLPIDVDWMRLNAILSTDKTVVNRNLILPMYLPKALFWTPTPLSFILAFIPPGHPLFFLRVGVLALDPSHYSDFIYINYAMYENFLIWLGTKIGCIFWFTCTRESDNQ